MIAAILNTVTEAVSLLTFTGIGSFMIRLQERPGTTQSPQNVDLREARPLHGPSSFIPASPNSVEAEASDVKAFRLGGGNIWAAESDLDDKGRQNSLTS